MLYHLTYMFPTPLNRTWMPHYSYMFTPAQLAFLVSCLDQTSSLPGPILEVGCARGHTTLYLNQHMDACGLEKPYICLDTFSGFTERDIRYEVHDRKKDPRFTWHGFGNNDQRWFDRAMELNGVHRVRSIQTDVNEFEFSGIENISFCLLDVDLYLPAKACLEKLPPKMAKGGIMVIDDCAPGTVFDGAHQAYQEFVRNQTLPNRTVCGKLGVLYF